MDNYLSVIIDTQDVSDGGGYPLEISAAISALARYLRENDKRSIRISVKEPTYIAKMEDASWQQDPWGHYA